MTVSSLVLSLSAGMLAALNPCGFALLPAYLALLVGAGGDVSERRSAVVRALKTTAAMTTGFVAVFAVVGVVIELGASEVERYLPWVTVTLGGVLLLAGGWLLVGRALPGLGLVTRTAAPTAIMRSMAVFGVTYALASLSCTIAPFLTVVLFAFRAGSVLTGLEGFFAYAAGMGLVVATAAIAVALTNATLIARLHGFGRYVSRASGLMLVITGGYVGYYGWWELRVLDGITTPDPVIAAASSLQRWLTVKLNRFGFTGLLLAMVGLVAVTVSRGLAVGRRRTRR